ncbi:MAG: glycosyltransferase [Chloroflexota bacterium]
MKKILILMISGGGGHLTAARAVAGAVNHLYGQEVTTSIVDVSKAYSFPLIRRMDELFNWLTDEGEWVWKALWLTDDRPDIPRTWAKLLTPAFKSKMQAIYDAEDPDLVVTVHGFANHLPLRVLRKSGRAHVPFVTVVADLVSAHPVWFCREVDYCTVPTDAVLERALRFGMPRERVEVVGEPVDLKFLAGMGDKAALRAQMGLDAERPCLLVVGGGEGMGAVFETARAIATGVPQAQMMVVAGRNAELHRRLTAVPWEIPTHIYGFVENMPGLMSASDVLVTKAGSCTLAEAFVVGLPVIISGFIPGQEEGNVGYVQEHEAGAFGGTPAVVARIARRWLEPGSTHLARIAANARALARPEASLDIARRLHAFLEYGRDAHVMLQAERAADQ